MPKTSKQLLTTFLLLVIFLCLYVYRDALGKIAETFNFKKTIIPCSKTITYSLVTFDDRFNLSKNDIIAKLKKAEEIWENPLNKDFFTYVEQGGEISINLLYDQRQETSQELDQIKLTIDSDEANYQKQKDLYETLISQHTDQNNILKKDIEEYKSTQRIYNSEVTYWNSLGGAPEKEYSDLRNRKKELDAKLEKIRTLEAKISKMVVEINSYSALLKKIGETIVENQKKYNTVVSGIDREFHAGEYKQEGLLKSIDIYQFSNDNKLLRVLAHEFGHALGLEHIEDKEAIMYKSNQEEALVAVKSELDQLREICKLNATTE